MGNTYELKYHRDLSLEMREVRFWGSAVFKQFLLKLLVCYLLLPWRQNCKRKVLLKYALKRLTSCWKLRVFFFNVEFLLVSSVTGIQGWAWPAESHISKSRGWDQALPLILCFLCLSSSTWSPGERTASRLLPVRCLELLDSAHAWAHVHGCGV